jgi:hypothetical protein
VRRVAAAQRSGLLRALHPGLTSEGSSPSTSCGAGGTSQRVIALHAAYRGVLQPGTSVLRSVQPPADTWVIEMAKDFLVPA